MALSRERLKQTLNPVARRLASLGDDAQERQVSRRIIDGFAATCEEKALFLEDNAADLEATVGMGLTPMARMAAGVDSASLLNDAKFLKQRAQFIRTNSMSTWDLESQAAMGHLSESFCATAQRGSHELRINDRSAALTRIMAEIHDPRECFQAFAIVEKMAIDTGVSRTKAWFDLQQKNKSLELNAPADKSLVKTRE